MAKHKTHGIMLQPVVPEKSIYYWFKYRGLWYTSTIRNTLQFQVGVSTVLRAQTDS